MPRFSAEISNQCKQFLSLDWRLVSIISYLFPVLECLISIRWSIFWTEQKSPNYVNKKISEVFLNIPSFVSLKAPTFPGNNKKKLSNLLWFYDFCQVFRRIWAGLTGNWQMTTEKWHLKSDLLATEKMLQPLSFDWNSSKITFCG